ncbi:MAG: YjiH family protein [Emergencia sp.]|jgi:nucleoside recognition membrane protein YjiH|nr:YjiH family protein [Emergencia sp.]
MKSEKRKMGKFLIPSIVGMLIFLCPVYVSVEGGHEWSIPIAVLTDFLGNTLAPVLPLLCVVLLTISAFFSVVALAKPAFIMNSNLLKECFYTAPIWVFVRVLGAVLVWLTYCNVHAGETYQDLLHMFTESGAGGFILGDLLTASIVLFLVAGILLPLLLDFGLLEFVGAIFTKFMRPLFTLPGRSAVDCMTSWIGSGSLGVMLTATQYEEGYYSEREACVIATTFSAVSITFAMIVLQQVGLMSYFGIYYVLVFLVGIVCAVIVPRIPPLSRKKDQYYVEGVHISEEVPAGYTAVSYGLKLALDKAEQFQGTAAFLKKGFKYTVSMWIGVLPVIMAIGTVAMVLANHTPIFDYLGKPFLPLLNLLQVPEAEAASTTMIVGFTDMFTPAIIAAGKITSEMTRFIVATVSVTQVIYLSEIGGIILGSKIPVKFLELLVIFIERTIISLILVCPIAFLIF